MQSFDGRWLAAVALWFGVTSAALADAPLAGLPWHGWYIVTDDGAVDGPYDSEQDCTAGLAAIDLDTTQPPFCKQIDSETSPLLHPKAGYGDWRLLCGKARNTGPICNAILDVTERRSHKVIARLTVTNYTIQSTVLTIRVPLNVLLEAGLSLKIGDDVLFYAFQTCEPEGCYVRVPLTAEMDALLAKTTSGSFAVSDLRGNLISGRFSLKGLAEARAQMP